MVNHLPYSFDADWNGAYIELGSTPGAHFDTSNLDIIDKEAIRLVPKIALLKMALRLKRQQTTNGWLYFTSGVGNFGTDYELRGMANLLGPGWNRPEDTVYPISQEDADGNPYDGAKHNYIMRIEKGEMPPVEGFWSLTLYDKDLFFVSNAIDCYTLSQRDSLATNPDGSVDIFIQAESPGKDNEANWLPAPKVNSSWCYGFTARRNHHPRFLTEAGRRHLSIGRHF